MPRSLQGRNELMIHVDHIFIFSEHQGKEADELISSGLEESQGRYHPGQGTTNRKFLFQNFFLEILWVVNQEEINSEKILSTGLTRRSDPARNGVSPFGLCLVNTPDTDPLFSDAISYQPDYFPEGMKIDIVDNDKYPYMPWIFRLPFRKKEPPIDPDIHQNHGMQKLTKTVFFIPSSHTEHPAIETLTKLSSVDFVTGERSQLELEFDFQKHKSTFQFEQLPLKICY